MEKCELRNVCRACLREDGEFQSMFVPEISSGLSLQLSEMINGCFSIQVVLGDGLPEQICSNCVTSTVNMYLFKLQCEKSDKILREKLQKILYLQDFLKSPENVVKPEIIESEIKECQDETAIESFNNFDFQTYRSDSEDEVCPQEENNDKTKSKPPNKIKKFECEICPKRFSRNDLLLRHKIAHAIKMEEQKIQYNRTYESEEVLYNHVELKTEEFLYSCSQCDVIFVHKDDLEHHINQEHDKKQEFSCSCEVCGKKFSKLSHKKRHLSTIHFIAKQRDKQYRCTSCDKGFSRKEQFNHHMNGHSGLKPHTCDICCKGFNQISNLKDHMRTHNGEKPFLCSTCGKGFNQLGNLRQHTVRHSGVKAHLCSTCGNGFASKGELSAHLRKHTGARPFVCQVCNHGFTTSSSLTKHKRIHSGEKPYECDTCKMKFSRSGILARHKRTHTGEKPYKCKFCGKAFSQSNDLTSHLRIHTGEKPYICDECGQAFRQSSALKTHKKTHVEKSSEDTKPILLNGAINGFLPTFL